MSKLVITTFFCHYKYTPHWSLFSPYLKLNSTTLLHKQLQQTNVELCLTLFFLFFFLTVALFFFNQEKKEHTLKPWKVVYQKLICLPSENVCLYHGRILMFFALLSLLELEAFSLVMTLVSNKTFVF